MPGSSPSGTYAYDQNGNMISDSRRSLNFVYNFLNLLGEVKTTSGVVKTRYTYLSNGTKLEVRDNNEVNGFDYLSSLTYKKSSAGVQLETARFGNGVIQITDHLGSIRVIVDGNGVVKERNDYYPFGSKHAKSDHPQLTTNCYKYNGKEKQITGGLDYLDYGARMYDSGLGRWFTGDPMQESYYALSPYSYRSGNPIKFVDILGMWIDNYQLMPDGKIKFLEATDDNYEMRKYMCVLLVISCCCACKRNNRFDESNRGSNAFAPVLKDKIEDFISYTDSVFDSKEKERFYTLSIYKEDNRQILFLSTSFFYEKKRMKGYAFVNDRLLVYYGNSSGQEQDLVDVAKLIQFVDTIPGYWSDAFVDRDYLVLKRDYVIHGKDSLSLIYSGLY